MRVIARLTDENVLGLPGLSCAEPRKTARGILLNDEGLCAVIYAKNWTLHLLPGGGMEEDETPEEALRREMLEETGCHVQGVQLLGVVEENRAHADFTQLSYYFVAYTAGEAQAPMLTEEEEQGGAQVQWHTLQQTLHLIEAPEHDTAQRKFLQARDAAVLRWYIANGDAAL